MCLCRQKDSRGTTALEKHNMESPLYHPHILETLSGFCNLQAEGVPTLHAEHAGRFLAPEHLTIGGSGYEMTYVLCTGFSLPGLCHNNCHGFLHWGKPWESSRQDTAVSVV